MSAYANMVDILQIVKTHLFVEGKNVQMDIVRMMNAYA